MLLKYELQAGTVMTTYTIHGAGESQSFVSLVPLCLSLPDKRSIHGFPKMLRCCLADA